MTQAYVTSLGSVLVYFRAMNGKKCVNRGTLCWCCGQRGSNPLISVSSFHFHKDSSGMLNCSTVFELLMNTLWTQCFELCTSTLSLCSNTLTRTNYNHVAVYGSRTEMLRTNATEWMNEGKFWMTLPSYTNPSVKFPLIYVYQRSSEFIMERPYSEWPFKKAACLLSSSSKW